MHYRAHAVLHCADREQAAARLREQLRVMAVAGGVVVDWTTLAVEGPLPAVGMTGAEWSGWTATVSVERPAVVEPVVEPVVVEPVVVEPVVIAPVVLGRVGAAGIEPATARL